MADGSHSSDYWQNKNALLGGNDRYGDARRFSNASY
jgi:hypothetical protein